MNETLLISILAASITAGTPILFAALGELISEQGIWSAGVHLPVKPPAAWRRAP